MSIYTNIKVNRERKKQKTDWSTTLWSNKLHNKEIRETAFKEIFICIHLISTQQRQRFIQASLHFTVENIQLEAKIQTFAEQKTQLFPDEDTNFKIQTVVWCSDFYILSFPYIHGVQFIGAEKWNYFGAIPGSTATGEQFEDL